MKLIKVIIYTAVVLIIFSIFMGFLVNSNVIKSSIKYYGEVNVQNENFESYSVGSFVNENWTYWENKGYGVIQSDYYYKDTKSLMFVSETDERFTLNHNFTVNNTNIIMKQWITSYLTSTDSYIQIQIGNTYNQSYYGLLDNVTFKILILKGGDIYYYDRNGDTILLENIPYDSMFALYLDFNITNYRVGVSISDAYMPSSSDLWVNMTNNISDISTISYFMSYVSYGNDYLFLDDFSLTEYQLGSLFLSTPIEVGYLYIPYEYYITTQYYSNQINITTDSYWIRLSPINHLIYGTPNSTDDVNISISCNYNNFITYQNYTIYIENNGLSDSNIGQMLYFSFTIIILLVSIYGYNYIKFINIITLLASILIVIPAMIEFQDLYIIIFFMSFISIIISAFSLLRLKNN